MKYTIMINYGLEGWKIYDETNDFRIALEMREAALQYGLEVRFFKKVELEIKESITFD